ncbi:MAG: hypothetical protein KDD47_18320, partial [Acidobacteria bacterium]|nr:hypothetical protein [Acidobacteriota bacterium]
WPKLLLDQGPSWTFLPVMVVVMASCLGLVIVPGGWAARTWARTVLGVGILLSLQYAFLVLAVLLLDHTERGWDVLRVPLAALVVEGATLGLFFGWRALQRRFGRKRIWGSLVGLLGSALAIATYLAVVEGGVGFGPALQRYLGIGLGSPLVLSLMVGPVWSADALIRVFRRLGGFGLGEPRGRPLMELSTWLGGFAAYAVSWRFAMLKAMEAYEQLPDSPPDCFVATAAGHAPPRLTGGGPITLQLRRLKALELLLRAVAPVFHRRLRRLYDRWGPPLAARIRTPARAALAWLALKPAEGLATILVRLVGGPTARQRTARLYGGGSR